MAGSEASNKPAASGHFIYFSPFISPSEAGCACFEKALGKVSLLAQALKRWLFGGIHTFHNVARDGRGVTWS
jgi:hypothetical protein